MDIAAMKSKPQSAPYTKSLKVRIVQTGKWTSYQTSSKKLSYFIKFAAADLSGILTGIGYDKEGQEGVLVEGASLLIRGYLYNNEQLKLTSSTKIFKCQTVDVAKEYLGATSSSPKKKIGEIQNSPVKQSVCVEGAIIKEEAVKSVKVGTRETKVKEITVSDTTGEVRVSLWDKKSESPIKCGDTVEIDGFVKFSPFHGENTLSVSAMSSIKVIELPPQVERCQLIAISATTDSSGSLDVIVQFENASTEQEFSCSKEMILNFVQVEDEELISPLLPVTCTISVTGKQINNIY